MPPAADTKFSNELSNVASIIGQLGLSIAEAQKAFNLDYLNSIERLVYLSRSLLSEKKAGAGGAATDFADADTANLQAVRQLVIDMIMACAPSRYQYTETTLSVQLDLAQSLSAAGSVGVGFGMSGIVANASFSMGYGSNFRAAAECKTVIHAIPTDKSAFTTLLDRAKALADRPLALPTGSPLDDKVREQAEKVFTQILGVSPAKLPTPPANG